MKDLTKILIGYDGSECADSALDDMKRAGFPEKLRATVLTVADVILPPPDDEVPESELLIRIPEGVRHALVHAEEAVAEARALAERATQRIKQSFPGWQVTAEASGDSPAWALIKLADQMKCDLIVLGSHGHSILGGRLVLGSVSQRVLYEAHCSVRIARCLDARREGPFHIVIGYDGTPQAELAVDAVASRIWMEGSEVRLITASHSVNFAPPDLPADKLRAVGLTVSTFIRESSPAHVLIEEADHWSADSVFVGTRDIHGLKHFLSGSVSSAVAARASCSVEVVRQT